MSKKGFTLIELLVAIGIIAVIVSIVAVAAAPSLKKARDAKRQQAVSTFGRFLAGGGCFVPAAGPGDYDLADLAVEIRGRYPAAAQFSLPRDPHGGTEAETGYRYAVSMDGATCAAYANLENGSAEVTVGEAVPGERRGTGVLRGPAAGRNGTTLYFQSSN
jgi:prepilin-type N-terminal cleavage/methylation domain-containing protein